MSATHKCPVAGCDRQVAHHLVMCPLHWRAVPKGLADAVYRTHRRAPGSALHMAAVRAAVTSVESLAVQQPWTMDRFVSMSSRGDIGRESRHSAAPKQEAK